MGVNDQVTISNGNKTGWLLFKKSDSETNSNVLKWSQMAFKKPVLGQTTVFEPGFSVCSGIFRSIQCFPKFTPI